MIMITTIFVYSIDDDEASECDKNSDDINQNDENDYGDDSNN